MRDFLIFFVGNVLVCVYKGVLCMGVFSIFFSPTNSTEKIVKIVSKEFGDCQNIDLCNRNGNFDCSFSSEDICIVGVPSYGGRVPAVALERMDSFCGNGAKAVLAVAYGNRDYDDTLKELEDFLNSKGFHCVAAMAVIAEHSIMHQFASGRPNVEDEVMLKDFSRRIHEKILNTTVFHRLELPGNFPYKKYNGVPLKPKVTDACTKCGLCASVCPVGAISLSDSKKTDKNVCISCMRCVEVCPEHARKLNSLLLMTASKGLESVCKVRKENEIFL